MDCKGYKTLLKEKRQLGKTKDEAALDIFLAIHGTKSCADYKLSCSKEGSARKSEKVVVVRKINTSTSSPCFIFLGNLLHMRLRNFIWIFRMNLIVGKLSNVLVAASW